MESEKVVDYAMPLMNIERMAAEVYDLCIHRTLSEAEEKAVELIAEARVLLQTLRVLQNK